MRLLLCSILALTSSLHAADWPNWRGPNQDGSSHAEELAREVRQAAEHPPGLAGIRPRLSASVPVVLGRQGLPHRPGSRPPSNSWRRATMPTRARTRGARWSLEGGDWQLGHQQQPGPRPPATTDGKHVVFLFAKRNGGGFRLQRQGIGGSATSCRRMGPSADAVDLMRPAVRCWMGARFNIQAPQRNEAFEIQGHAKGHAGQGHEQVTSWPSIPRPAKTLVEGHPPFPICGGRKPGGLIPPP